MYVALGKGSMGLLKKYRQILQSHNIRFFNKLRTGLLKTTKGFIMRSFFSKRFKLDQFSLILHVKSSDIKNEYEQSSFYQASF